MQKQSTTANQVAATKGGKKRLSSYEKVYAKFEGVTAKELCERNQVQTPAQLREEVLFRMLRAIYVKLNPTEEERDLLYVQEMLFYISGKAL